MTDNTSDESRAVTTGGRALKPGWGLKLFLGVLVALLFFFWWLLIWSGGVDPHQD